MDDERYVDNVPSIRLKISCDGNEGTIHFSSVWESYNFLSDIESDISHLRGLTDLNFLVLIVIPNCKAKWIANYARLL